MDSGGRNFYSNVNFGGMGDAASAADAGSRSIKITSGENTFDNCSFGLDTVARSAANANIELYAYAVADCVTYTGAAAVEVPITVVGTAKLAKATSALRTCTSFTRSRV